MKSVYCIIQNTDASQTLIGKKSELNDFWGGRQTGELTLVNQAGQYAPLAGGRIEGKETPLIAATRELHEECGIRIDQFEQTKPPQVKEFESNGARYGLVTFTVADHAFQEIETGIKANITSKNVRDGELQSIHNVATINIDNYLGKLQKRSEETQNLMDNFDYKKGSQAIDWYQTIGEHVKSKAPVDIQKDVNAPSLTASSPPLASSSTSVSSSLSNSNSLSASSSSSPIPSSSPAQSVTSLSTATRPSRWGPKLTAEQIQQNQDKLSTSSSSDTTDKSISAPNKRGLDQTFSEKESKKENEKKVKEDSEHVKPTTIKKEDHNDNDGPAGGISSKSNSSSVITPSSSSPIKSTDKSASSTSSSSPGKQRQSQPVEIELTPIKARSDNNSRPMSTSNTPSLSPEIAPSTPPKMLQTDLASAITLMQSAQTQGIKNTPQIISSADKISPTATPSQQSTQPNTHISK